MKIYNSIESLVGQTPLLRLNKIEKALNLNCKILAKLEGFNPAGSIKDRVAKSMLDDAEKDGLITKGGTVIEATSGNTGIGLACIGTARGYKVILTMPDTMSLERINLLKAYGAQVVLTDGALGMQGAIDKAQEIKDSTPNSFIPSQFTNPANPQIHYQTTVKEIIVDTDGKFDAVIAGVGSAGTISGVGKGVKEFSKDILVVGVEPQNSPLITKGYSNKHLIQGIGANFIPKNYDASVVDTVKTASDSDAYYYTKLLANLEGLLVGISSGANLSVAVKMCQEKELENKTIVVIFADSGERYISTGVFND